MPLRMLLAPEPEGAPIATCFVIAPIGNEHAPDRSPEFMAFEESLEIYEMVILPACARYGIVPARADGIADSGGITEQICRHVLQDDIVIADLTGGLGTPGPRTHPTALRVVPAPLPGQPAGLSVLHHRRPGELWAS